MWLKFILKLLAAGSVAGAASFDPYSYSKTITKCPSINRATGNKSTIDIAYVELNPQADKTLLFVHGWPALWSTWSNQIQEFQTSYHLLVPDLRGFGGSSHPGDVQGSGTMGDLVGDLVCVLEQANVRGVVCVGHDWGSQICYEAARMRPDIIGGVVGAVVPYIAAAGDFTPVEQLAAYLPSLSYQIYFEKDTEGAITELNKDILRSIRSVYRTIDSPPPQGFLKVSNDFLGAYESEIPASPCLSEVEEAYLLEQYALQGFDYTLQFYTHRNRHESHAFSHEQGNFTISQPALAIYPTEDPVADWLMVAKLLHSDTFIPKLSVETIRSQHWPQLEAPEEFNRILGSWLDRFAPQLVKKKFSDEL